MKLKRPSLQSIAQKVARSQGLLTRLLLTFLVWGLCLWAANSLQTFTVRTRMPALQGQLTALARSFNDALAQLGPILSPLATDPRLVADTTAPEALLSQRRAIYEFSYINHLPNITLINGATRWQPANAEPLLVDAAVLRKTIGPQGFGLWLGQPDDRARLLLSMPVEGSEKLLVLQLPWPQSVTPLVPPLTLPHGLAPHLISTQGDLRWNAPLTSARLSEFPPTPESAALQRLTSPLPAFPGLSLAVDVDLLTVGQNIHIFQALLVALAFLLSLVIFWVPLRPFRQKAAHALISQTQALQSASARLIPQRMPAPDLLEIGQYAHSLLTANPLRFAQYRAGPSRPKPVTPKAAEPAFQKPRPITPSPTGPQRKESSSVAREKQPTEADLARLKQELDDKRILAKIKSALQNNQAHVLFHPVYSAETGQPTQQEVLLRLLDSANELSPGTFIPVALRHGFMPTVDATALQLLLAHHEKNPKAPFRYALNLSSKSMDSLDYLKGPLSTSGNALASRLVFEVQSRELMADKSAMHFLKEAQTLGAQVSVDYFGGGKSALDITQKLGFNFLKVNVMAFWNDLEKRKELVGLARTAQVMGLPVIFEKIETAQMDTFARRIGVPYLQGYYYAQPSPIPPTAPLTA